MENTGPLAIRCYLEDALAAEKGATAQLLAFAQDGDDDEVRQAFAAHAGESQKQCLHLEERLEQIGGNAQPAARSLAARSHLLDVTLAPEERIVQNLIAAYTEEAAECALHQAMTELARAAGDDATAGLSRVIQTEAHRAADKFWSFIHSRSIIAFNILTIGEVDPAVETKVGEVSWS